jgi:hypothetical protein
MIQKHVPLLLVLSILGLFVLWGWWQRIARKRFVAEVKTMAESDKTEIDGQPVDYWLDILNRDSPPILAAIETMVLTYKGQNYFFVHGTTCYIIYNLKNSTGYSMKSCFLIAVGEPAVELLFEEQPVFRKITGSTELAAFSIYQWSEFVRMLEMEVR